MKQGHAYINGRFVLESPQAKIPVIDPATERKIAEVGVADADCVDRACRAAAAAGPDFAVMPLEARLDLLQSLLELYRKNAHEIAALLTREIGVPRDLAARSQMDSGARQITSTLMAARRFRWESRVRRRDAVICHEPIGVAALITPWNWPMNQLLAKLAPAIATGCTVVLKPSELTPMSSLLIAELIDRAGFPAGVFNLVNGPGATTGAALVKHPIPRLVSFTGSLSTGREISRAAAEGVKRVTLELGGKSPCLVFADSDVKRAVAGCVRACFRNSGQNCNGPTRLLVEAGVYEAALDHIEKVASGTRVAAPSIGGSHIGPVAGRTQYERVQAMIDAGLQGSSRLLVGGAGRQPGMSRGFYVRPTVFADVDNQSRIAREEIFGPVLCVMPFRDEAHAIVLANDTDYGLAAYVHTSDEARATRVARALDVGMVHINGARHSSLAPFGGVKASGNGREHGESGLLAFLETKTVSQRRRA